MTLSAEKASSAVYYSLVRRRLVQSFCGAGRYPSLTPLFSPRKAISQPLTAFPRVPAHNKHDPPTQRPVWAIFSSKGAELITKPNRSLTEQIFGIGRYTYSKDGQLYFIHGNSRIKVTEHFPSTGKSINLLMEDLIQFAAKQQESKPQTAVKE